jgi:hypothetical protein
MRLKNKVPFKRLQALLISVIAAKGLACESDATNYFAEIDSQRSIHYSVQKLAQASQKLKDQKDILDNYSGCLRRYQADFGAAAKLGEPYPEIDDLWLCISQETRGLRRSERRFANLIARESGLIDDLVARMLEQARQGKVSEIPIPLSEYHKKTRALRNLNGRCASFDVQPRDHQSYHQRRENFGKVHGYSARERLYILYDYPQIKALAQLMKRVIERMEASRAEIRIYTEGCDDCLEETIPLTITEQYRLVLRLFQREWETLRGSKLFESVNVRYIDVISASFEYGTIEGDLIDAVFGFEEFWNPKRSKMDRFLRVFRYVTPFVPNGSLAVLAIVGLEAVDEAKSQPVAHHQHLF